jgi:hypothetical protein
MGCNRSLLLRGAFWRSTADMLSQFRIQTGIFWRDLSTVVASSLSNAWLAHAMMSRILHMLCCCHENKSNFARQLDRGSFAPRSKCVEAAVSELLQPEKAKTASKIRRTAMRSGSALLSGAT